MAKKKPAPAPLEPEEQLAEDFPPRTAADHQAARGLDPDGDPRTAEDHLEARTKAGKRAHV